MRKRFKKICLKHPGRGHEEPVGGVHYLQVLLVAEVPDLGHEGKGGVDDSGDTFFKGANNH